MVVNKLNMVVALCLATAPALAATPVATVVANDHDRQLSFDAGTPDGGHAIVLRDAQGQVVRELDLGAFLPAAYVHALPRGEGGLQWWRAAKLVANDVVEFSVPAPGSAAGVGGPAVNFSIDLHDGIVRTAQIREYLAAADQARALEAHAVARLPGRGSLRSMSVASR